MRRLKQLAGLSAGEWVLLSRAIFWLPASAILVKLNGFESTLRAFACDAVHTHETVQADEKFAFARTASRMINVAACHGIYRARCLHKSLVLVKFMSARDFPSKLLLGVRREGEEFGAHAWVECDDIVVNDDSAVKRHYATFAAPPGRPS